jgi:hypothetical protein
MLCDFKLMRLIYAWSSTAYVIVTVCVRYHYYLLLPYTVWALRRYGRAKAKA